MTETDQAPDILADLADRPMRPVGTPCRIAVMRRDRPDLISQWDRAIEAKKAGRLTQPDAVIADWFTARGFEIDTQIVQRHRKGGRPCTWCRTGFSA